MHFKWFTERAYHYDPEEEPVSDAQALAELAA
jgi:hypothetical protein